MRLGATGDTRPRTGTGTGRLGGRGTGGRGGRGTGGRGAGAGGDGGGAGGRGGWGTGGRGRVGDGGLRAGGFEWARDGDGMVGTRIPGEGQSTGAGCRVRDGGAAGEGRCARSG